MTVSVVIITKNEECDIAGCIQSARLVTDDIIVVDSGSSDATLELAKNQGVKIIATEWKGYGSSKNKGAAAAKHDWIFSLDADERITWQLAETVKKINPLHNNYVYQFKRVNYLGNKKIRFGTDGFDKVIRIYNRHRAEWDLTPVHEKLAGTFIKEKIHGSLIHYSTKNWEDYKDKLINYAKLSAGKYFKEGKKANLVKRFIAPLFNSLKSYFFQLGFLDGKTGFKLAGLIAYYTWLKYHNLHLLHKHENQKRKTGFLNINKPLTNSTIAFSRK